ncbi:MAG: Fur family transcriptional regulator [Porcipelethomonas sp.]
MRPSAYNTKQKEKIFNYIKNNSNRHITAAEIVSYLSREETPVGTATVYRYLDKLVSGGVIRKYTLDEKSSACYQYINQDEKCSEHFHLKCTECGRLIHTDCSFMQSLDEHIFEHHQFRVDNSRTVLYGRCRDCEKETD